MFKGKVGLDEEEFDDKDIQEVLGVFDEVKLGLEGPEDGDDDEESEDDYDEEELEEEGESEKDEPLTATGDSKLLSADKLE